MKKNFRKFWKSIKIIYSNFENDRAYLRASGLSYITFLAFIPFVMVTFLFTPNITVVKMKDAILEFIFQTFIPKSADVLKDVFNEMLARRTSMDVIGIILLLVTSFYLFKSISHTFDKIMKAEKLKKRSVFRDFERFIAAIVGGFVVVAALLFVSSVPIISQVVQIGIFIKLIPYLGMTLLIFAMYEVVCTVHPKVIHALIGAVSTSILWSLLKGGFDWYIATFTNVRSVYGTLGAFPIFMIWLYCNWLAILFGMEIVAFLSGRKKRDRRTRQEDGSVTFTLSLEKQLPRKLSQELKRIKRNNVRIDDSKFMDLIAEIIESDEESTNKEKDTHELQKERRKESKPEKGPDNNKELS